MVETARTAEPLTMPIKEAEIALSLKPGSAYSLMANGTWPDAIPVLRMGKKLIVSRAAVHAYVNGETSEPDNRPKPRRSA